MNFIPVFDAAQFNLDNLIGPAVGITILVFGWRMAGRQLWADRRETYNLQGRVVRFLCRAWLCLGLAWTSMILFGTVQDYVEARDRLRSGDYSIVEGTVEQFRKTREMESFVVNGKFFQYSDSWATSGFNNTTSSGGPMKNGLHVRIAHPANLILRLEIASGMDGTPPNS